MFTRRMECGCVVEMGTHCNIIYCARHKGNVNPDLFRLAQKICMWDGDSEQYTDILRHAFPIVKRLLHDPELKTL